MIKLQIRAPEKIWKIFKKKNNFSEFFSILKFFEGPDLLEPIPPGYASEECL